MNLVVEYRSPENLKDHPANARLHPERQLKALEDSIGEFGFVIPIIIDEFDTILAGHGRRMVAVKMELAEVPVVVVAGLTELQKRAYVVADNKIAEQSTWDADILKQELARLEDVGFDPTICGFTYEEIKSIGGEIEDIEEEPKARNPAGPKAKKKQIEVGTTKIPFTDQEREGLEEFAGRYYEEHNTAAGLLAHMLDRAELEAKKWK